jgi:hypothetical protein
MRSCHYPPSFPSRGGGRSSPLLREYGARHIDTRTDVMARYLGHPTSRHSARLAKSPALVCLCRRAPFIAAFARWPGCGDVTQDCSEHGDCCRVFNPLRESVLESGAPRVVRAGLPDGFPFLLAQARLRCRCVTSRACLIVCPVVCVRAFTCRRACERRDGTTCGTITHGDSSPVVRARHRPRLTWIARPAWACSRRCR